MRPLPVLVLARMLLRFFSRRVLRVGVLRSIPVRAALTVVLGTLLAVCAVAAYAFLAPLTDDARTWELLFSVSTVSALLWLQVGFLLVKVLFLSAGGLSRLTHQLPVTHRERAAAFMIYEAVMTGVVAGAGFFAVCVATVILLGPAGLVRLLEAIVLPMLLGYLVLTAGYLLIARACSAVGLGRLRDVVLVLVLFAVLIAYTLQMPHLTAAATTGYLHGQSHLSALTVLPWLTQQLGAPAMVAIALTAAAGLFAVDLWLTPRAPSPAKRFVTVRLGRAGRHLQPDTWFVVRSTQTWLAAALAWALYAYLALTGAANPIWALGVTSVSGLYQFAATRPLREIPGARRPPWRVYLGLLRAQAVVLGAMLVPGALIAAATAASGPAAIATAIAGCLSGGLVTVGIGIVFPAENDNPFSVFIGLGLTAALLAVVGIALGLLNLPRPVTVAAVVTVVALYAWYSVEGIRIDESRRRHEEGRAGREQRRGGRPDDLAPHHRDDLVSHVHQ